MLGVGVCGHLAYRQLSQHLLAAPSLVRVGVLELEPCWCIRPELLDATTETTTKSNLAAPSAGSWSESCIFAGGPRQPTTSDRHLAETVEGGGVHCCPTAGASCRVIRHSGTAGFVSASTKNSDAAEQRTRAE